ncbi:MAG TPA: OmpA family protein [Thermoanaerobaculia bacterium]|nr:OmpA family protein [Thermoanaerobaculia bacterium]
MIDKRFWLAAGVAVALLGASPAWAQQDEGVRICNPLMEVDGDPVTDVDDKVVRTVESEPCPVVAEVEEVAPAAPPPEPFALDERVNFEFDRSNILPQFEDTLNQVAAALNEHPNEQTILTGHTDSIGTEEYNLALAERRAGSVAEYLQARGVPREQLVLQARGEAQPIASNETEQGRFLNRRVEITAGGPTS